MSGFSDLGLRRSDWPIFVMQLECGAVLAEAKIVPKQVVSNQT